MYNYSYNYSTNTAGVAGLGGVMAGFSAVTFILSLIPTILLIVAQWKIFVKAGEEGWKAIIPVYNLVVLFKIAGMNPMLLLLLLIPIANIVILIVLVVMLDINLAKAFGKGTGFAIGLIFLGFIFQLILAFDSSEYVGIKA